jgi:hypothetical protein
MAIMINAPSKIVDCIDNAPAVQSEKLPLQRPASDPIEFPMDALGPLQAAVDAIHTMVQAPYAMCANSVLAAVCLAVQGHADVQLPIANKSRPLSCFFLTIGASGERKSAVDSLALRGIAEKEKVLKEHYQRDMVVWKNAHDVWEASRKKILQNNKMEAFKKRDELNHLGSSPQEPIKPLLTFPEPTYQGLHKYLEYGQPSVGVFSAEGGQFIGGHAMKDENKMETAAGFNALWDGEPLKRVRSGDGTSALYGKRVGCSLARHYMILSMLKWGMIPLMQSQLHGSNSMTAFRSHIILCLPDISVCLKKYRI